MRLFIALNFPETSRSRWLAEMATMRSLVPRVRWVQASQMHLTVAFLGEQPERVVSELRPRLDAVASRFPVLALEVQGVGVFPGWQRPRVVWLGVTAAAALMALAAAVADTCRALTLPLEERPFHPHITLGRVDSRLSRHDLEALERAAQALTSRSIVEVSTLDLMVSTLGTGPAKHEVVHEAALGRGARA